MLSIKIRSTIYLFCGLALFALSPLSYALFCPSNFSQIYVGDSIQQVTAMCGKPDVDETKEVKAEGPQEWTYFIPQTVATQTAQQAQGTLKTQISFDASGKAVNISVNGIGVGATTICGNNNVELGDTKESIKTACGDPVFVNKQQETSNTTNELPADKVTTYTYKTNPPVKLTFVNGKLTNKE